ncbi:MAG: TetR/AcrR family transcriptional regulator [Myxococcota bacterium]
MQTFDLESALDRAIGAPRTRRGKLLSAAERLFAERGYDGVRVRDVADAAGVNVATLHLHWKSKATLYEAVCRLHARELMAFVERVGRDVETEGLSLGGQIQHWVEAAVELLAQRPPMAPLALQSVADQTPPEIPTLFRHDVSLFRGVERALRKEIPAGEHDVEPILAVLSVFYFSVVVFSDSPLQRALLGGSVYGDAEVRARVARFAGTLVARLTGTA